MRFLTVFITISLLTAGLITALPMAEADVSTNDATKVKFEITSQNHDNPSIKTNITNTTILTLIRDITETIRDGGLDHYGIHSIYSVIKSAHATYRNTSDLLDSQSTIDMAVYLAGPDQYKKLVKDSNDDGIWDTTTVIFWFVNIGDGRDMEEEIRKLVHQHNSDPWVKSRYLDVSLDFPDLEDPVRIDYSALIATVIIVVVVIAGLYLLRKDKPWHDDREPKKEDPKPAKKPTAKRKEVQPKAGGPPPPDWDKAQKRAPREHRRTPPPWEYEPKKRE